MSIPAKKKLEILGHDLNNVFLILRSSLTEIGIEQNNNKTTQVLRRMESQVKAGSAMLSVLCFPEIYPERAKAEGKPTDLMDALRSAAETYAEGSVLGRALNIVIKEGRNNGYHVDVNRIVLEESLIFLLHIFSAEVVEVDVGTMEGHIVVRFEFRPRFENDLLRETKLRFESLGGKVVKRKNGERMSLSISFPSKDDQGDKKSPTEHYKCRL